MEDGWMDGFYLPQKDDIALYLEQRTQVHFEFEIIMYVLSSSSNLILCHCFEASAHANGQKFPPQFAYAFITLWELARPLFGLISGSWD